MNAIDQLADSRRFDGADFQQDRDGARLSAQLERIRDLMLDGAWRTLEAIAAATGAPQPSVSAQLRHLRKERFGAFVVEKRHVGAGLYEYRVERPQPKGQGALFGAAPSGGRGAP